MSVQREIKKDTAGIQAWQAPLMEGPIAGRDDGSARPPTAKQMQVLQKEAYDEAFARGHKEGMEKGYREGRAAGEAKLKTHVELFHRLLSQLASPLEKLDDDIEKNIVALTVQIARHLVRREMRLEPGEIVAVVREAVGALPVSAPGPRIYLHPEDAEVVRTALSVSEDETGWKIIDDLALTRGDCRVETASSLVDASVDARLSAISAKILGGERDSDSNG